LIEICGVVFMTIDVKFKFTSKKIEKFKDVMYFPEMREFSLCLYSKQW